LTVTTPPTITAATNVNRSQGNLVASSNSQIATVNDVDQTENTLVVTVNGGASATVNGVTVSSIAVDAAGSVTANVVADASATTANFTLRAASERRRQRKSQRRRCHANTAFRRRSGSTVSIERVSESRLRPAFGGG
jgi:hypothetical protein